MQSRPWMNPKLRALSQAAEAAARKNDMASAVRKFIVAGDYAVTLDRWRSAERNYRAALELDLLWREPVARLLKIADRLGHERDWRAYIHALEGPRSWPHFGCRSARVVASDTGAIVECNVAGPLLELMMSRVDLVEAHPVPRFANMPLAMALLIIRRALWIAPRAETTRPHTVRVVYGGHEPVWLDERGDWGPD